MKGSLLLIVCLFGFIFPFFGYLTDAVVTSSKALEVRPSNQTVNEYEDVVIHCFAKNGGKTYWSRPHGRSLPKQATQKEGRLTIRKIEYGHEGPYICYGKGDSSALATVTVIRKPSLSYTTLGLRAVGLVNTESPFKTTVKSITTVDVSYSCLYGICNGTCCERNSVETFFDCADGQKINRTLVCNRVNDCKDGSDESGCGLWPSKITVLPKPKVEVYCGNRDGENSGTLILECESVGRPIPVIRWKKYNGHVPSKCTQFSTQGYGILNCPDFQQSDQGAYSCVAENAVKAAESQPKSLVKCSNTIPCFNGFKVINEEQIEHCIECYCSGKTTKCQSIKSNVTAIKIPFPENPTEIFAKDDGEILFVPTKTELTPNSKIRNTSQEITYCSLSENDLQKTSFLKSFGRSIIIPRYKGNTNFVEKAPDLIIRGNGLSLMYTANLLTPPKYNITDLSVRFWPGNWHHLNKREARRKDLMKVLSNVDSLFLRCEYQQGSVLRLSKNATITIESSTIKDSDSSISYIEKCSCPFGYDGLSCETCAAGYERKPRGNDFTCEKIYIPPPVFCPKGYVNPNCSNCDTSKGYIKKGNTCVKPGCHPIGSTSLFSDFFKNCTCRERVVGDLCDRCENGSFYLHKARGCLKCWCSGVTNQCNSSNLYRTVISNIPRGGYNSSDGRNFWLLPPDFSGNRLTSYGGYLNYTMKYKPRIPKENNALTVELLSMDDVTLIYTHRTVDSSLLKQEKSWVVPLTEIDWIKSDKSTVTRDEFMKVLSKIKAVYIESPYHLSSGQANLTSARMSSASEFGDGESELALAVEQCKCPTGYTGLSCEKCGNGYYRKRNGTITQCIKCNCTYCDPDFGCPVCPKLWYRDNPEEEKLPVCKPCSCNGNGVSCVKDDHNQIFCRCKPGFTGMHCENPITDKNNFTISISPRTIRKKVGTTVFINCSVLSGEEMTLTVKKTFLKSVRNDSKILSIQGSRISEHFEVELEDGLEAVECIAHDSWGRLSGHVVSFINLITVIQPVRVENCYSDRIDIKESESKDIICRAGGSPKPIINWYKMKKGSESVIVDTLDGVHTIESPSLKDNGTIYTCVAENSEGDKATCVQVLIVRKNCEVINIFPKQVRVYEGENISIQCKNSAKSPVNWGVLSTFSPIIKKITSPRAEVQKGFLFIRNATVSDSATYICTAVGENGNINQTVSVLIEEKRIPPSVSISEFDKTLKQGENFNVNCLVTGKPTPSVTWKKLNDTLDVNVIVTGKLLQIKKATLRNSGIYVCEARSNSEVAFGYISIEVEETLVPPRVNISEKDIIANEGEVVTISCLAIGYPQPKLTWFSVHPNFTISRQNNEIVLIEPNESIKEEIRFKVTKEMDGLTISCIAENTAGKDEKRTKIKVYQPSVRINETLELVPIGSYFELLCEFPGNLRWKKVGSNLVGDECRIPNALMIPSVQIQHNGTYICEDELGLKKIINLKVVGFVPKFSKASKSFLVLPTRVRSLINRIRIEMSFNTVHENGVLLERENGKFNIYLKRRKILLSIYGSSQNFWDVQLNEPIEIQSWYSLVVSITEKYVDVTIYNEMSSIHERKTENFIDFNVDLGFGGENFFVGGPTMNVNDLGRMFLRHHPHFDGCISRLSINDHEYDIVKESSHSHNVTLCRKCFELRNPCEMGKCLDAPTQRGFICVCSSGVKDKGNSCPTSCYQKGCETQLNLCQLLNPCNGFIHKCINKINSLQCDCAPGYSGNTCDKVQEYSFCANGDGYVRLPSILLERHIGYPEIIRMAFTLQASSGQLLWQGDRVNHLSVAVRNGILEYVYLNQHTKLEVQTTIKVLSNNEHILIIRRLNNTVYMEVTEPIGLSAWKPKKIYRNATSKFKTNRVTGDIYLGNVPNNTRHITHHTGLNGCIHYISFGERPKINFQEKALEKYNVFAPQNLNEDISSGSDDDSDYNYENSVSDEFPRALTNE